MTDADIANLNEADEETVEHIKKDLGYFIAYEKLFDGIFTTLQTGLSKLGESAA